MFTRRATLTLLAGVPLMVGGGAALAKRKFQKDAKNLLGNKIKQNGHHKLDKAGQVDVEVDVNNGKVVNFTAKHPKKGNLAVRKVKSREKLALNEPADWERERDRVQLAQTTEVVWYYAYWFTDENGDDWYYWFPVEYIIDDGSWQIYS